MKILFCRSFTVGSLLIRLLTFSRWSHSALIRDDGMAIEATWPRVRMVKAEQIIAEHDAHAFGEIGARLDAWEFAERQVGKPYDLGGLWNFMTSRDWTEDSRWFCSELVAAACGGWRAAGRVTPEMLWEASR